MNEEAYKNAVAAFKKIAGSTKKEMSRKQFTKTLTQKYPPAFADLIFDTFDTDGNGTMSVCLVLSPVQPLLFFFIKSSILFLHPSPPTAERVPGVHGSVERWLGGAEAARLVHAL